MQRVVVEGECARLQVSLDHVRGNMADKKPKQKKKQQRKNKSKASLVPSTPSSVAQPPNSKDKSMTNSSSLRKTRSSGPVQASNDSSHSETQPPPETGEEGSVVESNLEGSPSNGVYDSSNQVRTGISLDDSGENVVLPHSPATKLFSSFAGTDSPPLLAGASLGRAPTTPVNMSPSPLSSGLLSVALRPNFSSMSAQANRERQAQPIIKAQIHSGGNNSKMNSGLPTNSAPSVYAPFMNSNNCNHIEPDLPGERNLAEEADFQVISGDSNLPRSGDPGGVRSTSPDCKCKDISHMVQSLASMESKLVKLDSMETKLKKLDGLESIKLSVRGDVAKVHSKMDELAGHIARLTTRVAKQDRDCGTRSAELADRISKVEEDRNQLRSEWGIYKVNMQKDISKFLAEANDNKAKIRELETQIASQETRIQSVTVLEERLKQAENLVATQKEQLASINKLEGKIKEAAEKKFQVLKVAVKKEVRAEVIHEFRVNQRAANAEVRYDLMKDKAQNNILFVVVGGLPESNSPIEDQQRVKDFFKDSMGLPDLDIDMVHRLGAPQNGSSYSRPLLVRFARASDRWQVWNRRNNIIHDNGRPLWVQEYLPKQLRDDRRILQRVAKMARLQPSKYSGITVRDFKIRVNGTWYGVNEVRKLPPDLQPEVIYTPRSESSVVFFTKQSPLSNHHTSNFKIDGTSYTCVEQYLAYHRATLQGNEDLAKQAFQSNNPADHKVILNKLKREDPKIWQQNAERIAYTAVREKFLQNRHLADFLIATYPLAIGEASRDKFWGVGLTLENKEVLDPAKWAKDGNLLGRILTAVRQELVGTAPHGGQSRPRKE